MTTTTSTLNPLLQVALEAAAETLRRVAAYKLEPDVEQRMLELGGDKEACSPDDRHEYSVLAEFWRKRTLEKLQALNALKRLHEAVPELVEAPDLFDGNDPLAKISLSAALDLVDAPEVFDEP